MFRPLLTKRKCSSETSHQQEKKHKTTRISTLTFNSHLPRTFEEQIEPTIDWDRWNYTISDQEATVEDFQVPKTTSPFPALQACFSEEEEIRHMHAYHSRSGIGPVHDPTESLSISMFKARLPLQTFVCMVNAAVPHPKAPMLVHLQDATATLRAIHQYVQGRNEKSHPALYGYEDVLSPFYWSVKEYLLSTHGQSPGPLRSVSVCQFHTEIRAWLKMSFLEYMADMFPNAFSAFEEDEMERFLPRMKCGERQKRWTPGFMDDVLHTLVRSRNGGNEGLARRVWGVWEMMAEGLVRMCHALHAQRMAEKLQATT